MKCPNCGREMIIVSTDRSYGYKNNEEKEKKVYTRVIHQCQDDDVWITTEIPENLK